MNTATDTINHKAIQHLVHNMGASANFLWPHKETNGNLPQAMAEQSIQKSLEEYLASPFIHRKEYLTFSSKLKKAGLTYIGQAQFNNQYETSGSFSSICYFPKVDELDFAITADMIPEHLWQTNPEVLFENVGFREKYRVDAFYKLKNGTVGLDTADNVCVFGGAKSFDRHYYMNIAAYIKVGDFLNWYNSKGKAIIAEKHAEKMKAHAPAKIALSETVSEIKKVLKNKPVSKDLQAVIFSVDYGNGFGWCFAKKDYQTGQQFTLADGTTEVTILFCVQ